MSPRQGIRLQALTQVSVAGTHQMIGETGNQTTAAMVTSSGKRAP